ncbi:MAG TPA: cupin domain-containing protein [Candidatus Sulfotelmatobacter sp.]|nr:cupin domain-containing protein [Candidatus Sulfotelmatobacter sp.]
MSGPAMSDEPKSPEVPSIIAPALSGSILGSGTSNFVVAEWKDAGGPPGPPRWIAPLHLHRNDDEAWYVLEGSLCVRRGSEIVEARAGSAVFVARGTPHTYWNSGAGLVRYLLVMTGNVYSLIQDIHAMRDRSAAALSAVFEKHDSELVVE